MKAQQPRGTDRARLASIIGPEVEGSSGLGLTASQSPCRDSNSLCSSSLCAISPWNVCTGRIFRDHLVQECQHTSDANLCANTHVTWACHSQPVGIARRSSPQSRHSCLLSGARGQLQNPSQHGPLVAGDGSGHTARNTGPSWCRSLLSLTQGDTDSQGGKGLVSGHRACRCGVLRLG